MSMNYRLFPLLLLFLSILSSFARQALCQYQFIVPDPNATDLSQHWQIGDTIPIQWQGGWHGVGDDLKNVDLWITWFQEPSFSQLLQANVSLNDGGKLNWVANVSNDIVLKEDQFVFRFIQHSDPPVYTDTENESPSRGIELLPGSISSASSSMSRTATSTLPSASSKTSGASRNDDDDGGSGSHAGVIAGGVVGGLVFLGLIIASALLLLRYKRKNKQPQNPYELGQGPVRGELRGAGPMPTDNYGGETIKYQQVHSEPPVEMPAVQQPQELGPGR